MFAEKVKLRLVTNVDERHSGKAFNAKEILAEIEKKIYKRTNLCQCNLCPKPVAIDSFLALPRSLSSPARFLFRHHIKI